MNKKKGNSKKERGNSQAQKDFSLALLRYFEENAQRSFSFDDIKFAFRIQRKQGLQQLRLILEYLISQGFIELSNEKRYQLRAMNPLGNLEYEGVLDYVSRDFAYVVCEGLDKDVWIHSRHINYALDGDRVRVKIYHFKENASPEGEVVEIIKRARTEFVGKIELSERFAFVVVDHRKMHYDIFVHGDQTLNATHGDKVIVNLLHWQNGDRNPVGRVLRVLGSAGEHEVEMHSIIHEFGLPYEFPKQVIEDAESIPELISDSEIAKRRDFRNILTFTIDPVDAKDFDDALSYQILENGNIEVGIHIADVSYYLKENTVLDIEAKKRATSVYLVDRVIPMLPERLSNELCSLRPNEDKCTFSAVFELNEDAKILRSWYGRTLIHSDRRFSYEQAQELIEGKPDPLREVVQHLNSLAKRLSAQRFRKGAISFESQEVKFELDEKGKPIRVIPKIRKDAHKLIEEFMLLANKGVAEFVYSKKQLSENEHSNPVMIYRVHEEPDIEKLQSLSLFAQKFGYKVLTQAGKLAHSLNELAEKSFGKPEFNILQQLSIRSMAKARYTIQPLGHFGLAFEHYTHFTSPIRRYPDVIAHRLLQRYLDGKKEDLSEDIEGMAKHSSDMEKRASDAERASIKYKQVEYLSERIGETYKGVISGVTEWGIFVEITENACEGMLRISTIEGDTYEYDAVNLCIRGRKYGKTYTFGDEVYIRVEGVNFEKRTIDLSLVVDESI